MSTTPVQLFEYETDSFEHLVTMLVTLLPIMFPPPRNPQSKTQLGLTRRDTGFEACEYDQGARGPTRAHVCSLLYDSNSDYKSTDDFKFNFHYGAAVNMVKALLEPRTLEDLRACYNTYHDGDGSTVVGYRLARRSGDILDVSLCFVYYGK